MTTRAADQQISRLGPETPETVKHSRGSGGVPAVSAARGRSLRSREKTGKLKHAPPKQPDPGTGGACFSLPIARLRAIASHLLTVAATFRAATVRERCSTATAALAFALLSFTLPARAEIIDRIAVSVGNRVITETDLNREIRVAAFLDGVKPDFSPAGKRATAERMVEQVLIRRELEISRYPVPTAAEVAPVLAAFKKARFPQDEAYQRALAEYGVTDQDVKDLLLWQRTLLLFIEVRFQSGVQVTGQDIQDYFDKVVKPAAEAAHPGQPIGLEDYRDLIEQTIAGQRADRQMDTWLKEARSHTEIVFHDEVLQ